MIRIIESEKRYAFPLPCSLFNRKKIYSLQPYFVKVGIFREKSEKRKKKKARTHSLNFNETIETNVAAIGKIRASESKIYIESMATIVCVP